MADAPRVTVPVEQPLVDWFSQFIERHQEGCGSDTDALIACLDRVRDSYRSLSAAPAPEGGAVKSMGQRAYENMRDNNDNASHAMNSNKSWAELSDEERQGWEEDATERPHLYALATREEAPAEAGAVTADSLRAVSDETIRALLSCKDVGSGRAHLAAIINALRAQPPAREDAQPVAWIMRHMFGNDAWSNWTVVSEPVARSHMRDHAFKIGRKQVIAVRDTHPAPDALRVAVEAFKEIRETAQITRARHIARTALAALQAEQKGGA